MPNLFHYPFIKVHLARMRFILVIFGTLLCGVTQLHAQTDVRIHGVDFSCESCAERFAQDCASALQGGAPSLACDTLFAELLYEADEDKLDLPSSEQLVDYLVREVRGDDRVKSVLALLLKRPDGAERLSRHSSTLVKSYSLLLAAQLKSNPESIKQLEFWRGLWQYAVRDRDLALKLALIELDPDRSIGSFASMLSIEDPVEDQVTLKRMLEFVIDKKSQLYKTIKSTKALLVACGAAPFDRDRDPCSDGVLADLSPEIRHYLGQARVMAVLSKVRNSTLGMEQKLTLLSSIPYEDVRTPETHDELIKIFRQIEKEPEEFNIDLLKEGPIADMLSSFAGNDSALFNSMNRLILLEQSEKNAQRERERVLKTHSKALSDAGKSKSWSSEAALAIVLGTLFFSALAAFAVWRRFTVEPVKQPSLDGQVALSLENERRLFELLRYFELDNSSKLDELRRAYRAKARVLHPDVAGGTKEDFSELQEKYEECQKLLSERGPGLTLVEDEVEPE